MRGYIKNNASRVWATHYVQSLMVKKRWKFGKSHNVGESRKTIGSVCCIVLVKSCHERTERHWTGLVFGIISECSVAAFTCCCHWVYPVLDFASAVLCAGHA